MGLTDEESTRAVMAACVVLFALLVFYALRDAGLLPWLGALADVLTEMEAQ